MNGRSLAAVKTLLSVILAAIATVGLGGLLVWGFIEGRGEAALEAQRDQPIKPKIEVSHESTGAAAITLSPDLQEQAGIETMQPHTAPYQPQIEAYGSVLDLQTFTDASNAIANAQAQLAIAEAKVAASQAAFRRAQVLHQNAQNISTAQLEAAEATYQSDAASLRAAQVQTQNAAASAYQAWGSILGQSLVDGTALSTNLVQRKKVLVQLTLPLGVSLAQAPQRASIETATGQRVSIEFISPATRTDPKIQGVSFFYTADASSGALPGMNVIAFLPVGQPTLGFVVPATAVVWLQGRAWVYLQSAEDTFTRREIPTIEPQPGGGYVVPVHASGPRPEPDAPASGEDGQPHGFPTDQPIVVKGAQMLLSQEFSAQIGD
jgi:hypothetical protein